MPLQIKTLTAHPPDLISLGNIFLKPAFRQALAREFKMEAVNLHLDIDQQTVVIPAYLKEAGRTEQLIVGAGFDKTGEIPLPPKMTYPDLLGSLVDELRPGTTKQLLLRTTHHLPLQEDRSDKIELAYRLDQPCAERLMQFSKSTRRNIRKPFKNGFHFVLGKDIEHLEAFYTLYLISMHELGSLAHSWRFFRAIWEYCQDDILLFVGYMDQRPVATAFLLLSEHEIYTAWGGAHPDYKKYSVMLAMFWSLFEFCEETGRKRCNLGRSSWDSPAYTFKKRLANEERNIYYYTLDTDTPDTDSRPTAFKAASWVIRNSPPWVMNTLSRKLIHRFY